jgi:signal transduction histidine kinase
MVFSEGLFLAGLIASEGQTSPLVNVWLSLATQWIPVSIFWLMAWRTGFTRLAVILAAAAVTFSALGDSYYSLAMDADGYLASPSPADVGYLLFYPLMVAALVMLVRRRIAGSGGIVLLESVVATLGASAVLAVILGPVIADSLGGETFLASVVAVAYPVFDLLILAVIAGIASVPAVSVGRRWWALIIGLGIFAAADVAYAILENQGSYVAGTPLDASWAIGLGFLTLWVSSTSRVDEPSPPRRGYLVPIPSFAVTGGLAVLIIATQIQLTTLAIVLAGLTVGLAAVPIIFRQAMLDRVIATQKEAMKRLTDLDRDKSDMMVTLNHEFRTPLTSINGHVELLLDGDAGEIPPAALSMLRTIESNGSRLQDLVDDMLTVSRLQHGINANARTPIYLSALVTRAASAITPVAKSAGVDLVCECDNFALVVDADGTQLERAMTNLIDNAVKFTPAGGHVRVHARTDGDEILVRVTDTGMGVPTEDLPHLFRRFYRASNVQKTAIPGVGLGLSITHGVIEAHGGRIGVQSTLGEGTVVSVRLPVSATGVLKPHPVPIHS